MPKLDHTYEEAVQWALNHAEAAEACDKAYRHGEYGVLGEGVRQQELVDLHREQKLAGMWAQIAQAMRPVH